MEMPQTVSRTVSQKMSRFVFLMAVGLLMAWMPGGVVLGGRLQPGNQNHNNHHNNHHTNHHHNNHSNHHSNHHNRHHNNHYSPGYHIDHHDHVIKDSHGNVIGNYHHDVLHENSTYIVPHTSHSSHHGTYYVEDNNYFYRPQTAVAGHVAQKPAQVAFGAFSHVDDLAERLETLSNQFCIDLHYNYAHNHGFRETYREAYQVMQVAKYIHAAEHAHDREAIRGKLGGLDRLFHHVQDDVRGWSRHHRRQVGKLGINSKMDMIESTLHHLMNDVGVHLSAGGEQAPQPARASAEQAPVPL